MNSAAVTCCGIVARVRVTQIDWRKVIPSLRLLDAISLAVSPRVFLPVCVLLFGNLASDWLLADRFAGLEQSDRLRPLISLSGTELPKTLDTINRVMPMSSRPSLGGLLARQAGKVDRSLRWLPRWRSYT